MRHAFFLSVTLFWAVTAQADSLWDSLWYNADQRGEQLLQQGDAAAAAQTYRDPRRKAYAELQSGDFANAAEHFSAFDDSNANYNRGNALAQAGQLEEALKAYDAALAQNPDDKDARHNRDLVARALQQQPPQSESSADKNSSSRDGKDDDKKQDDKKQSGNKDADKQDNTDKDNSSGQNQSDKQQQDKAGRQNGQQPADQQKQAGAAAQKKQTQDDEAEQARRDAAAALDETPADDSPAVQDTPLSEKQLSQEKWLRAIPDDPGGLLRRKFMIEHMIRQKGGQQ